MHIETAWDRFWQFRRSLPKTSQRILPIQPWFQCIWEKPTSHPQYRMWNITHRRTHDNYILRNNGPEIGGNARRLLGRRRLSKSDG